MRAAILFSINFSNQSVLILKTIFILPVELGVVKRRLEDFVLAGIGGGQC